MYLPFASFARPHDTALLILSGGCAAMLSSVLLHSRGLAAENREHVTRRALGRWLPIAITVLVAVVLRHTDLAVALVFGTSVAAISGVTGFILIAGPVEHVPPFAQRIWLFAPVPAILTFVLGIRGELGPMEAFLLLAQGSLLLVLCLKLPADEELQPSSPVPETSRRLAWKIAELSLSLGLGAVGAWLAIRGTEQLAEVDRHYPFMATGATILSVVLAMPIVNTSWPLAASGRAWAPLTSQLGVVFLNLCVLLPVVILLAGTGLFTDPRAAFGGIRFTHNIPHGLVWNTVLYPRIAWRLDTVVLVIVTLLFVPAAGGKLRLDWRLSPWLICGYFAYLLSILIANSQN